MTAADEHPRAPPECPIPAERRNAPPPKDGWTLWREVYGTLIGTLPFVVGLFIAWQSMSERVRVMEVNHDALKAYIAVEHANIRAGIEARDRQNDRDREQIMKALDRISTQIEVLQSRTPR